MSSVVATDNFNRANETNLVNPPWDSPAGTAGLKLASNVVTPNSLAADETAIYVNAIWPDNQYSQVQVTITSDGTPTMGIGVGVRMGTAPAGYRLVVNDIGAQNVNLGKSTGAGFTSLLSAATTYAAGDTYMLQVSGSILKVFKNGVQIGSDVYDTALQSGKAGIYYSSTAISASVDNWEGGAMDPHGSFNRNVLRPKISVPGLAR
jgi:hypothetical protein